MLTDLEIIKNFNIKSTDKILDVGGAMKQHPVIKIDTLVDIIRPENAPYCPSRLRAKKFVKVDITKDRLPFEDKQFDFSLCTHTLEDLYNPFLVMDEMLRVAKKGYITTPSMGIDMVFSHFDITNWMTGAVRIPGNSHHKWFFVRTKSGIKVIPKNYGILYSINYDFTDWKGKDEMEYYWEKKIIYERVSDLNIHSLIDEYEKYVSENKAKFVKGKSHFFVDKPSMMSKAYLKLFLKRGKGFSYRKINR